ncbi:MAG: hypothetical protein V5789_11030 [Colwellia sp.]
MNKKVLTARRDGTTERLNAIIHGIYIAKKLKWDFAFSWVVNTGAIENKLMSIDNFLPSFFNPEFVKNYYVDFEQFKSTYFFEDQPKTMCEYVSGTEYKKIPSNQQLRKTQNILPSSIFHDETSNELEDIVKEVIDPAYFSYREAMMTKVKGSIGLHYRGGDVVYGLNRHGKHAIGDKSVSLAVIEDYIVNNSDERFIVFGTPIGDTENDMQYLNNKYSNITLSKDLRLEHLDHVLQDCFLMSCCKTVACMSGTGVTRFANMINSDLTRDFFHETHDVDELYKLFMQGTYNLEYNKLQRSFHAVNALNLKGNEKDSLLEIIKKLDPENRLTWLK